MRNSEAVHAPLDVGPDGAPSSRRPLAAGLEAVLGYSFLDGNSVRVLRNGVEIFPAMLDAIAAARHSIDFLTYVYWEGEIAIRFAEALAARAEAGVAVRVLLDAVGAAQIDEALVQEMEAAGADVAFFRPADSWRFWRVTHRTHRKVLVCDGCVGFTGGVGIADEWTGNAEAPNEWRETHLEIRGPAVAGLRAAFYGNWLECRREPPRATIPLLADPARTQPLKEGDVRMMVVHSTASIGWSEMASMLWTLFSSAERRIRIATAYFVPDEHTVDLLCEQAANGVEVQVLIPGPHIDERMCNLAHGPDVEPLLTAGVAIYRYQPTMMHAKVMLVDDLAVVGSPNLNHRSMQQDDECCVVIDHKETRRVLHAHFDEDLKRAQRTTIDDWKARPWWKPILERFARLFRPQL